MPEYVLVCEAAADARAVRCLIDRCLIAENEWARDQRLDDLRQHRGLHSHQPHTEWKNVPALMASRAPRLRRGLRPKGLHGSAAGAFLEAQRAIRLFELEGNAAALILVRDTDEHTERVSGLEEARATAAQGTVVIIGAPHPEMEAWQLLAFVPANSQETEALETLKAALGFDPTRKPHLLRSGRKNDPNTGTKIPKNAKSVADALWGTDQTRPLECLETFELDASSDGAERTGLGPFLTEARTKLGPTLGT